MPDQSEELNLLAFNAKGLIRVSIVDFVDFWSKFYTDPTYDIPYEGNIKSLPDGSYTLSNIEALMRWKAGAQFARRGEEFAKKVDLAALDEFRWELRELNDDIHSSLEEVSEGYYVQRLANLTSSPDSFIWPRFVLHIAAPEWIPIYDQHAWRSYRVVTKQFPRFGFSGAALKQDFYPYVQFFNEVSGEHRLDRRQFDRALWGFGLELRRAAQQVAKRHGTTKSATRSFVPQLIPALERKWAGGYRW